MVKFYVIAIAIEYTAKVITISRYFMIIAFVKHRIWSLHLVLNTGCIACEYANIVESCINKLLCTITH